MPNAFNFSASPFDCLSAQEQELVRNSVDIAYFKENEPILKIGTSPSCLYIIIKGYVRQLEGEDEVAIYGPDDCFDGRALMSGKVSNQFIAAEEVLAYELSKATVNELISSNGTFAALLFSDLSEKLKALSNRRGQHEVHTLSMASIDQAFLQPAHILDADTDVLSVVKLLNQKRLSNILVRDHKSIPPRLGIFTRSCLGRAIVEGTPLNQLQVGQFSNFALITAKPSDPLYDALASMIRHKVSRVVVMTEDDVIGILEQVDLLSFLANSSALIAQKIFRADRLEKLQTIALEITNLIRLLYQNGTKISMIAKLVQELNAKLFAQTWSLVASQKLQAHSCLFVMGSEGRGEQLLKTDQDNGLVVSDDYLDEQDIVSSCQRFSEALMNFGYPECPGKIMVNNPQWRMTSKYFSTGVKNWVINPTPEHLMSMAIFIDAHAVAGDSKLLENLRQDLFDTLDDNQFLMARFASTIDSFSLKELRWNPLHALSDHGADQINLKKAGIFAIVHGVRSLALENKLLETGTIARLEKLVELEQISQNEAKELTEGLHFLMSLKLKAGLFELDTGKEISGDTSMNQLSSLERDLLKDALHVVKNFKASMRQHFHLDFA